jgi:glycosidase
LLRLSVLSLMVASGLGLNGAAEEMTRTVRAGSWELSFDAKTGDWRSLRWNGAAVADFPEGAAALDVEAPRGQWLCAKGKAQLTGHEWNEKDGTLLLKRRSGEWELDERVQFGAKANPNRIERTLRLTHRPAAPGPLPPKFHGVRFTWSLPKQGTYLFPGSAFDKSRTGDCAALPGGFSKQGAWGIWPLLLQQAPGRTLLFMPDARRDAAWTSLRAAGERLVVTQQFGAQGWAEPNVTQTIGPAYLDIAACGLEDALKSAVWKWYDDVGLKVPADRPDWTRDAVLYSCHPGGTIGSDFKDLGGFKAMEDELLPVVQRLGIGALWLLPLEDRGCYWPRDYRKFQEGLGTAEEYRRLVAKAHELGLKVWQDNVPHGGSPAFGRERGNKPWWLIFDEKGDAPNYWCFDFREPEWQKYIAGVADHYVREFNVDGFRIDAVGGSHGMNWRRAGFPPADRAPANVPAEWWREALKEVGGQVPALPYERGSLTQREGGLQMEKAIRDAVKKLKPAEGATLAEVQNAPYMQEADAVYDFSYGHHGVLMRLKDLPPEEFVPGLQRWLEEQKCAEPRGTLRLRYLESHDTVRARSWYGVDATKALTALTLWIDGLPMLYHDADIGLGTFLQRAIAVRNALPELRRGGAFYEAVKAEPACVFTCLRTTGQESSVVAVNLSPRSVEPKLYLPVDEMRLDAATQYTVWEALTGSAVASGSPRALVWRRPELGPWQAAVYCFRPAGGNCPVPPLKDLETEKPGARELKLADEPDALRVTGERYEMVLDKRTGLIRSFRDAGGRALLGSAEMLLDVPTKEGESPVRELKVETERQGRLITVRFSLRMTAGGGATLTYRCGPGNVLLHAALDRATPGQRAGLVFAGVETARYQVSSAEGLLDDEFAVRHAWAKAGGSHGIYYRPPSAEVQWNSETCPLHLTNGSLRSLRRDGVGVWLDVAGAFREVPVGALVMDRFSGQPGWHAAFLWRDTRKPLGSTDAVDAFTLMLGPVGADRGELLWPGHVGNVSLANVSTGWEVENAHYRVRLDRAGGIIRGLWEAGAGARPIIQENDLYTDKGFRTGEAAYASAGSDGETGVRVWGDEKTLRMRFHGELRNRERFGLLRPPIRFAVEYAFDGSPAFRVRWSVLSEGPVRENAAFMAWYAGVPDAKEFVFRRGQEELARGALNPKSRAGETARLAGAPVPDTTILSADGKPLLTLSDLALHAPQPLQNVFVHGGRIYLAWLDAAGAKITPGTWYEASAAITPGAKEPGKAPSIPWLAAEAEKSDGLLDPSFEGPGGMTRVSDGRRVSFPGGETGAWSVPSGGQIASDAAHSGGCCAKVVNTTGEYLLFSQALSVKAFPPGSKVRLSAWVKGQDIVRGDAEWKVGTVRLFVRRGDGKQDYLSIADLTGAFDWRKVEGVLALPENAVEIVVHAGLNGAKGTMWIDDVEVKRE